MLLGLRRSLGMRDTSPGWDHGVSALQMYVFVNCHYLPIAWKAPPPRQSVTSRNVMDPSLLLLRTHLDHSSFLTEVHCRGWGGEGFCVRECVLLVIGVERTSGPHMLTDRSTPCVYLVAYFASSHTAWRYRPARMCPLGHILVPPQMCVCVCVCVCCICDSYEIDT
jgi:hypothetical protein